MAKEAKTMKMPELLAPAGSPEKLDVAMRYGADAVYAGLSGFSLRSRAGNFTLDDLADARARTNHQKVKLYVAANLIPRDEDMTRLEKPLAALADIKPDAVIVSDPGVLARCCELCPKIPIHLSTQANVINTASATFWFSQGVRRIILARELGINQIADIQHGVSGELEVFVHGALCISYSGRCYLSSYMTGRDANQGDCAQSCRWSYRVLEESRRTGSTFPVEEDEQGTYVFNSRDLCALPVLHKLTKTGVSAFKIEGRMKSVHYVAATVDVYRTAMNILQEEGEASFLRRLPSLLNELKQVSNRQFTTAFLNGTPDDDVRQESTAYENQYTLAGIVSTAVPDYTELTLKNPVAVGETVTFLEPGMIRIHHRIQSMVDHDGEQLDRGRAGDRVRIEPVANVLEGAIVRR